MVMHEKLKEIRVKQGLSVNKASLLSGGPHASIRRLEEGTVNPTVWTVERLCKAYKINVWDVMNPNIPVVGFVSDLYALNLLVNMKDDDPEFTHGEADAIICDILNTLGYEDIVNMYNDVSKWYG